MATCIKCGERFPISKLLEVVYCPSCNQRYTIKKTQPAVLPLVQPSRLTTTKRWIRESRPPKKVVMGGGVAACLALAMVFAFPFGGDNPTEQFEAGLGVAHARIQDALSADRKENPRLSGFAYNVEKTTSTISPFTATITAEISLDTTGIKVVGHYAYQKEQWVTRFVTQKLDVSKLRAKSIKRTDDERRHGRSEAARARNRLLDEINADINSVYDNMERTAKFMTPMEAKKNSPLTWAVWLPSFPER